MNNKIIESAKKIWQHKVAIYLSYLTIFLIPLYFNTKHFSSFVTPKIILTTALLLLVTIFYLWGNWFKETKKILFSIIGISLFVFILFLTISSIKGIDPLNSFLGWKNVVPLISIYFLSIFAFIVGDFIKNNKKIAINLLLSSFISSILVTIFFYSGIKGVNLQDGSTLGNSSYLGTYLMFNFFFGLGLILYHKKIWQRFLLVLGSLFLVINPLFINKDFLLFKISLSQIFQNPMSLLGIANGATMGVGLSVIFIVLLFFVFSKKKILKIAGFVLIVLFLLGISFVGRELSTSGTSLNKIFVETKSGNRFLVWDIAKRGFLDNPVLGNGYNNYIYTFDKYYSSKIYEKGYAVERFFKPHNVFWEFASDTGILGLLGYLCLLVILFITLININKDENNKFKGLRIVLAGLIIGYFIQNLFVFDTISSYLMLFIVISIGIGFANFYEIKINEKLNILKKVLIAIFILFLIWMMYVLVIAPWRESVGISKLISKDKIIDISKSVQIREGLSDKSIFLGVMDSTNMADGLFLVYQNALSKVNESNKKEFLKELVSIVYNLEKDIEKQPNFSESYLAISKILNLHLMIEMKEGKIVRFNGINYNKEVWGKSYESLMKSIGLNPNNPQSYLVLAQLYMLKADFENAYLYNRKAIEMAPNFKDSYDFGKFLMKVNPNKDFENFMISKYNNITP